MLDDLLRTKIRDVFNTCHGATLNIGFITLELMTTLKVESEHWRDFSQYIERWVDTEVNNAGFLVYGSRGGVKLRTSKDGSTPFENGKTKRYEKK